MFRTRKKHSATGFAVFLSILLLILFVKLDFQQAKGDWISTEPIYIRANGTIEPSNAPISTADKITYTLTENLTGNNLHTMGLISVERNNVVLDGKGHLIKCTSKQTDTFPSGISITGNGGNVTIKNFEIRGFSYGIRSDTQSAPAINNKISSNILADNYYGVFWVSSGTNNEITENQMVNNQVGLSIQYSGYNLVSKNIMKNNLQGISLSINSSYNKIFENTIENNGWGSESGCAVEIYPILPGASGANYNVFYHNDFVNNVRSVTSPAIPPDIPTPSANTNYWDNGFASGGNYWSDYVGTDLHSGFFQNETCRDGIGDTPYAIDGNNRDQYPLLKPWQEHLNPPVARFQYSPEVGYALKEISFNSSLSYDLDENIKSFLWDFADGNTTSTVYPIINHTFSLPGIYNVSLTVFDETGLSTTFSVSVRIIAITDISISTKISSIPPNLAVSLIGNLEDMFLDPLTNELVLFDYTYNGTSNWYPIASATTNNSGMFETVWFPPATGQFTIRASWIGNSTYAPSQETTSLDLLFSESKYLFSVESNSTISSFAFDSQKRKLSFTANGPEGTEGYAKVTVTKSIIDDIAKVKVKINNREIAYATSSIGDSWVLFFTYPHSTNHIMVDLANTSSEASNTEPSSAVYSPISIIAITGIIILGVTIGIIFYYARKRRVKT
jgi:parallel beta-helix repeat protein